MYGTPSVPCVSRPGSRSSPFSRLRSELALMSAIFPLATRFFCARIPPSGHPEQLVRLHETTGEEPSHSDVTYVNYRVYRERAQTLSTIAVARSLPVVLSGDGPPVRLSGELTSDNYFTTLEVTPVLGRGFVSDSAKWRLRRRRSKSLVSSSVWPGSWHDLISSCRLTLRCRHSISSSPT